MLTNKSEVPCQFLLNKLSTVPKVVKLGSAQYLSFSFHPVLS